MIHYTVRNIIPHISIAFTYDCCKPNVPINMKICRFKKKKSLTYFHSCDLLSFHLRYYSMIYAG